MRARIAKWGNSLAVRIPRTFADQLGVTEGSPVDIAATGNAITVKKPVYALDTLLSAITPENLHDETGTGRPVGRETW